MSKSFLIAAGLAVLLAGAAQAQPQPPRGRGGDLNGDGRVSLAEMQGREFEMFARLDANRDGRLSRPELGAARATAQRPRPNAPATGQRFGGRGGAMFERADLNRDGVVTRQEADAALRVRFQRLDVNRDGFVTAQERHAARPQQRRPG